MPGAFYLIGEKFIRAGILSLASHTGWAESEIKAMPVSDFLDYLDGLPRNGK
jgi:hypothetical protein